MRVVDDVLQRRKGRGPSRCSLLIPVLEKVERGIPASKNWRLLPGARPELHESAALQGGREAAPVNNGMLANGKQLAKDPQQEAIAEEKLPQASKGLTVAMGSRVLAKRSRDGREEQPSLLLKLRPQLLFER